MHFLVNFLCSELMVWKGWDFNKCLSKQASGHDNWAEKNAEGLAKLGQAQVKPPRKILNTRIAEIIFPAILVQNHSKAQSKIKLVFVILILQLYALVNFN